MGISTSQFKQLFKFFSGPRNTNTAFIISKNIKFFHKKFRTFFIYGEYGISTKTTFFEISN